MNDRRWLWTLLPCAIVLSLAAWLRGAEYDEQYTLFLTAGVARPDWPPGVFPAGLAREIQAGHASLAAIADDLRTTDVHPPLYFWPVSLWRAVLGPGLFTARLFSVALGVGSLALVGMIARSVRVPPMRAMLLTLGCYGFAYTSMVARGFALAQLLLLSGVVSLLAGRRGWHFTLAGMLFGAATLSNYLSGFVAGACLMAVCFDGVRPGHATRSGDGTPDAGSQTWRDALLALIGFVIFLPADFWWLAAQHDSRRGQFPPFSVLHSLTRLVERFSGNVLGGLPQYVHGAASVIVATGLGLLLAWLIACVVWRWRHISVPRARRMFALAALAPATGLLALGAVFDNTPIEVRYLAFATPFIGLLLAGALNMRGAAVVFAVQSASIAGLMFAPQTMQPARAAAHAAAAWVEDGVVLLPRGNDGVGVVGAFAIEAPPALPLLLIRPGVTPEQIRARIVPWHRIVLALIEQDAASVAACDVMRQALSGAPWREVAHGSNVAVYERGGT